MKKPILIEKNIGETPLEVIKRYKEARPAEAAAPITYAGRLDPMAGGLLILLSGEDVHHKDHYTALPKTYEVDILLGFSTDTHDVLGLVTDVEENPTTIEKQAIVDVLENLVGPFEQSYPAYSSKTVDGKPLWQHAREGAEPERPTKNVQIYDITLDAVGEIIGVEMQKTIEANISKVSGDFRQESILARWREALKNVENKDFQVVSVTVSCSSGTYMRSLAQSLGKKLGVPALAYRIYRTKIGDWKLDK